MKVYRITTAHDANAEEYFGNECVMGNAAWAATREQAEAIVASSIECFGSNYCTGDDGEPLISTEADYDIEEYDTDWCDDDERDAVIEICS